MTSAEFFQLVGTITYKPDIFLKFELANPGPRTARLTVSRQAPDATRDDRKIITIVSQVLIDFGRGQRDDVLRLIFSAVSDFEMHELKEWFKVEGRCFVDPHPDRKTKH